MNAILDKTTITKTKKYFVKDESLHGVDGDMFSYADIAKVLDDVISTNPPPFNIAVIGKWGLGKSSLINLVTDKYKKDNRHYFVQEINAWKYEKESLRRVFLKQLWQGISNQRVHSFEIIRKELSDIVTSDITTVGQGDDKKKTKKFWTTSAVIVGFTAVAFLVYKIIQALVLGAEIFTWDFVAHVILRYCKNISTVLVGPVLVALCKLLFDEYHSKQTKKIELNFPIETTDDYELFLETKIKEKLKENPDLKIITVIDDLDRLSIDKIVEALDALKAFVGFERCVFIVPFDDEIIKRALDKRRAQDFNEKAEVIESELILDKLFQYKVYLPPILDFDIQQYAFNLAMQEVPDFISDYCDEHILKKAIYRILIHPGVTTPRQVKKLLNSFINNYMIVAARESSGKIQKGLLTSEEGIMQIAKMSVLQADFNNFYDLLFKDMRCLNLILEAHRGDIGRQELPSYLHGYFEEEYEPLKLRSEHEPLLNFLIKTEKYRVNSIAPYLYLAQDEISIKTGDELQRRALNALESGNVRTVRELLGQSTGIGELVAYQLSKEAHGVTDVLNTAMLVFEDIGASYQSAVAQNIIERVLESRFADCHFLYQIPADTIFEIAKCGDNQDFNSRFIERYLSVLAENQWFEEETLSKAVERVFANYHVLDTKAQEKLKAISTLCVEKDQMRANNLFTCIDPQSEEFLHYWGLGWFEKLCSYIDTDNDFSAETMKQLDNAFHSLKKNVLIGDLVLPLIKLSQYSAFIPTLALLLNQGMDETGDGATIKDGIAPNIATQLTENVIAHDFKKHEKDICAILVGLQFEVTEKNNGDIDNFTMNYAVSNLLDKILVYCGQKGYFELLPKTVLGITNSVFENDENDELLSKVGQYFTPNQVTALGNKLFEACGFSSSKKSYERELTLCKILVPISIFGDELIKTAESRIISHYSSYYSYEIYCEFVSRAIGVMKEILPQQQIDKYVQSVMSRYSSYKRFSLEAIDRVSMKMSEAIYKATFEKIVEGSETAEFEFALDIIINHDSIRPCDGDNLTRYVRFLVRHLATSSNPNRILQTLRKSFSGISMIEEMTRNALKNNECDHAELARTIAKFVDNKKSIEEVSENVLSLLHTGIPANTLREVLSLLQKYTKQQVYVQLANDIQIKFSPDVMQGLVDVACNDIQIEASRRLIMLSLKKSFEEVNQAELSVAIINKIKQFEVQFKLHKEELADVLREGFETTTSDLVKNAILMLVSSFKIKPQFKKTLAGEDLEYYKKWSK